MIQDLNLSFWHQKWKTNEIGFHQENGNDCLRNFWHLLQLKPKSKILVPLCGKSKDLLWLCQNGFDVTGVEISDIAAYSFFQENHIPYHIINIDSMLCYQANQLDLRIHVGNYFTFKQKIFDALFDRAAFIAIHSNIQMNYVKHTQSLLKPQSKGMIITLEYDTTLMQGPPYSISEDLILNYWNHHIETVYHQDLIHDEPRFQQKGLCSLIEKTWVFPKLNF